MKYLIITLCIISCALSKSFELEYVHYVPNLFSHGTVLEIAKPGYSDNAIDYYTDTPIMPREHMDNSCFYNNEDFSPQLQKELVQVLQKTIPTPPLSIVPSGTFLEKPEFQLLMTISSQKLETKFTFNENTIEAERTASLSVELQLYNLSEDKLMYKNEYQGIRVSRNEDRDMRTAAAECRNSNELHGEIIDAIVLEIRNELLPHMKTKEIEIFKTRDKLLKKAYLAAENGDWESANTIWELYKEEKWISQVNFNRVIFLWFIQKNREKAFSMITTKSIHKKLESYLPFFQTQKKYYHEWHVSD